jgi:hypothetical protein
LAGIPVSPDIHPPPQGGVVPTPRWIEIEERRSLPLGCVEPLLGVCSRNPILDSVRARCPRVLMSCVRLQIPSTSRDSGVSG